MFKRRVVQFENGKYGVRTYWYFGWHFLSIITGHSWPRNYRHFDACLTNDLKLCKRLAAEANCKYRIMKNG